MLSLRALLFSLMRLFTLHTLLNTRICCLQLNTNGRHGIPTIIWHCDVPYFLVPLTTFWSTFDSYWIDNLGRYLGKIAAALHHTFILGSPNERVFSRHKASFLAPLPGRSSLLLGESLTSNLFTLLLSCLVYFYLVLFALFIKNTQKISYFLFLLFWPTCYLCKNEYSWEH